MDAHPVDGEITLLTEVAIAEHLLRQVTELNVKCFPIQFLGDGPDHLSKQVFLALVTFCVISFA